MEGRKQWTHFFLGIPMSLSNSSYMSFIHPIHPVLFSLVESFSQGKAVLHYSLWLASVINYENTRQDLDFFVFNVVFFFGNPKELWCWRKLLRVPWTARRSNQSTLKEINPEYSLEGLVLKLKPQYFGRLMQRAKPLEKTLMLGNIEGKRRRGWQKRRWLDASLTQWSWVWANSGR